MHRYVRTGLTLDMMDGKRILVVTHQVKETLDYLRQTVPAEATVYRAHGNERICHPSTGFIRVLRSAAVRGFEVDVVYDETSAPLETVAPAVAPSGELLRPLIA